MNNLNKLNFFKHSIMYFKFLLLKKISEKKEIIVPIQTQDKELLNALSSFHIQTLIDEELVLKVKKENSDEILIITDKGKSQLKKDYIDYQLDLLIMENTLGSYYSEKILNLKKDNISLIALYGASDTARSIINHLIKDGIKISCIIDDDVDKQENNFIGIPIISRDEISLYDFQAILVTAVEFEDQIKSKINQFFESKYKIYSLFN